MLRRFCVLLVLAFLVSIATAPAFAQVDPIAVTINFNENCVGSIAGILGSSLPCFLANDPGPGGLNNVLFYDLLNPPLMVSGDVVINEPGAFTNAVLSDILRFDAGLGGVFVYSKVGDGDLADIGFPTLLSDNFVTFTEVGLEGFNGLSYTPGPGQPGYIAGVNGEVFDVTYNFESDVPEPATALLIFAPLAIAIIRKRSRAV